MDIYKVVENGSDDCGFITGGDARVIPLVFSLGETLRDLTGATFESIIPAEDGGTIVVADAQHAITTAAEGEASITLSAAVTARMRRSKKVPFMCKVTISGETISYWGEFSEVRAPLK